MRCTAGSEGKDFTAIFWWQKESVIKNATQFFQMIKYKYNMHWPIGRHEQAAAERLSDPHAQRHMLPTLYWSDLWKMELWAFRNVVVLFPFPLDLVDHIWVMVLMEMRSFHVLKYSSVFWKLCNGGWTHALLLPPVSMQKSIFNFLWEKWREWHEVSNVKSLVCCLLKCEYMMENAETHRHRHTQSNVSIISGDLTWTYMTFIIPDLHRNI